jgi:GntR family transcriptional regulator, transcriptional repressor for pyruvate dehydrogenase complex
MSAVLESLEAVAVERPAEQVFRQLRRLIVDGVVKPGQTFPSERHLAERFGLNRTHVREALQRLEFYGLVRTRPQSGTVVTSTGIRALDGLFSDVLTFDRDDVAALMETRTALETNAARFAAERATASEIADLRASMDAFRAEVHAGRSGIAHDLMFHLQVAEAAHNPVMRSLVGLLAPDIAKLAKTDDTCAGSRAAEALSEHEAILRAIEARDGAAAAKAMADHMAAGHPINMARRRQST